MERESPRGTATPSYFLTLPQDRERKPRLLEGEGRGWWSGTSSSVQTTWKQLNRKSCQDKGVPADGGTHLLPGPKKEEMPQRAEWLCFRCLAVTPLSPNIPPITRQGKQQHMLDSGATKETKQKLDDEYISCFAFNHLHWMDISTKQLLRNKLITRANISLSKTQTKTGTNQGGQSYKGLHGTSFSFKSS